MPAVKSRQWETLLDEFSDVMNLVHGRRRMGAMEASRYQASIFEYMVDEYERTLEQNVIEVAGCAGRSVKLTNAVELERLRQYAADVAAGMVDTYNRDLAYAVRSIRTEVPTANRNVYSKRLEEWEVNRALWKGDQVVATTRTAARDMSSKEFMRQSGTRTLAYVGGTRPAACEDCQAIIDGEPYDAQSLPVDWPLHVGCVHFWEFRPGEATVPCEEIWTGE